jgi:hypothetical protein
MKDSDDMGDWDGEERRNSREPWHVKKEISYGHILTTLTIAVGVILSYTDIIKDMAVLSAKFQGHVIAQAAQEDRQDTVNHEILSELKMMRKDMYEFFQQHNKDHK